MRHIADDDLHRLETAAEALSKLVTKHPTAAALVSTATVNVETVIDNIRKLHQSAEPVPPRVVEIPAEQLRTMYPERYAD